MENKSQVGTFKVFILTLPGDDVRRSGLVKTLENLGIEHELFFGVDGRSGLPFEFEDRIDRDMTLVRKWRVLSDGEYACALSHQAIYTEILRRGLPGGIVLEDDVTVGDKFSEFMRNKSYRLADMVLLFHHNTWVTRTAPISIIDGVYGYRIALPPYGAAGYSLSAKAADTILRRSAPISAPADWPCNIARLHCLALKPQIVYHPLDDRPFSHLQAERSKFASLEKPPHFYRLRRLLYLDDWFTRVGRRIGVRLE